MDRVKFGKKLRKLREKAGLSAPEMAKRVGYTGKSGIYKLEEGKSVPGPKIKLIAECLGVTIDELLDDGESLRSSDLKLPTPSLAATATMKENTGADSLLTQTLLSIQLRLDRIDRAIDEMRTEVKTHQHPLSHGDLRKKTA